MAFLILVQRFLYLLSSLSEVWFWLWFHLGQTESFIPLVIPQVLFWYCVLAYDVVVCKCLGLTFSALFLSMVILCVVGEAGFAGDCGISSKGGSKYPVYSPVLMWCAYWCNLAWEYSQMFFPLMLWMSLIMFMLESFPLLNLDCWWSISYVLWSWLEWCHCVWVVFESWLGNPNSCLLFTVSGIGEKSTVLLYVTVLLLIPGIWQGKIPQDINAK